MSIKIYVNISGGCYQCSENVPGGHVIEIIDWDNLLGDGESIQEWNRFDTEAKQFVRDNYPEEYKLIQDRLRSDQRGGI